MQFCHLTGSEDLTKQKNSLSEMPQTVISVSESVSPLYTVEREETAAQEQSVEEALIAAAAGVSVLPAECSGTDRDESTETADVVTTENTPHKSLDESVVSVTPVRSPIQMNMNEIADADDLNLVKEMPESLADNSELSPLAQVHPEEMLGFPSDQTSAAGGECPNTTDIGFITSGGIPCQEESLTETVKTTEMGTTSKVSSETSGNCRKSWISVVFQASKKCLISLFFVLYDKDTSESVVQIQYHHRSIANNFTAIKDKHVT